MALATDYMHVLYFFIKTTPEQDAAFIKAYLAATAKGWAKSNNCADAVGEGLKAAGLLKPNAITSFPKLINDYIHIRAREGMPIQWMTVPEGATEGWDMLQQSMWHFSTPGCHP